MYESEANGNTASIDEIPLEIQERFAESRSEVSARSMIPWGEHCTECSWPTCYTTCDLYEARADGKCRRFKEGMVRIPFPQSLCKYVLKITFKRWAKLWAHAVVNLQPISEADKLERRDQGIASLIQVMPWSSGRSYLTHKRYSWKKRVAVSRKSRCDAPNILLIECYNPSRETVSISLMLKNQDTKIPYLNKLSILSGFNRYRLAVSEIEKRVNLAFPFDVEMVPNEIAEGRTLYFGALDFIVDKTTQDGAEKSAGASAADKRERICKCVVWDLDNTLWQGTLTEDGANRLHLRPSITNILKSLDERGILIAAISKNSEADALAVLEKMAISDYFVATKINWLPKSQNIKEIASELNIGLDSFLFVDDSLFERAEVLSACPSVVALDAAEYLNILELPECQLPVTEESKKRRLFYQEQRTREHAQKSFDGEYIEFLRKCELKLTIRPLTNADMERVYELTQRTNQMNFSGRRYTREELRIAAINSDLDSYVLDCEDNFGVYGTIGFCLVNRVANRMVDLMFSCRIQAKRVEHAFINFLLCEYRKKEDRAFYANYRKTDRNAIPGKVFEDLGFVIVGEAEGVSDLCYPNEREISSEGIVKIVCPM